jgi:hypothetical protein
MSCGKAARKFEEMRRPQLVACELSGAGRRLIGQ